MQEMTSSICNNVEENSSVRLIDYRDGKKYWVTKIKDQGIDNTRCWMTQNLDLDLTDITLTNADSDMLRNWTPGLTSALWDTSANFNSMNYYDPGMKYCNTSGCNLVTSANNSHDAQGNYYSWAAATAGSGIDVEAAKDAGESICPKGWRLPTGGSSGEFYKLVNGLTGTQITKDPYYFVYSGYVNNSMLYSVGSIAAYSLYFYSSSITPSLNSNRYNGYSVRCVAR